MSDSLLSGKRCLVLDDEFLIALDIQQILEIAGAAHVACAATVPEALELLRREPAFDVAVPDVKLSGPDRNSLGIAILGLLSGKAMGNFSSEIPGPPVNEPAEQALFNLLGDIVSGNWSNVPKDLGGVAGGTPCAHRRGPRRDRGQRGAG